MIPRTQTGSGACSEGTIRHGTSAAQVTGTAGYVAGIGLEEIGRPSSRSFGRPKVVALVDYEREHA